MIVGLYVWHNGEQLFHCFRPCFTHILMPQGMIVLYFRLPCFHVSNGTLFLHSTLVLSFYIDAILTLFIILNREQLNCGRVKSNNFDRQLATMNPDQIACAAQHKTVDEKWCLLLTVTNDHGQIATGWQKQHNKLHRWLNGINRDIILVKRWRFVRTVCPYWQGDISFAHGFAVIFCFLLSSFHKR